MQNKYNHFKHYAVLLALAVGFMLLLFGDIVYRPNTYLFGSGGDGIKNYFTPAYYLKHDTGWTFSGMNYPYEEHVVFTDNQPVISAILNFVDNHLVPLSDYAIGIFNVLLLLSLLFSIVLIFKILRHYLLPFWYAIPTALVIGFFTPQIFRFTAHYALGYAMVIPAIWWLLIKIYEGKRKHLYSLLIVLFGVFIAWVHVYYVMIYAVFLEAYYTVGTLYRLSDKKAALSYWGKGIVMALLPMLIFQVMLSVTDSVTDRPENPYGIFAYTASVESAFLPIEDPLRSLWKQFIKVAKPAQEGYAYVGVVGLLVALLTLFKMGALAYRREWRRLLRPVLPHDLAQMFWAGILVLIFAMGLPFKLMPFLLDLVPPLKQFRSLGRFAWGFYYIFMVYTAVYIFLLYRKLCQKQLHSFAHWGLFIVFLLWGMEAAIQVKNRTRSLRTANYATTVFGDNQAYINVLKNGGYSVNDFQALLPLPFYHVGSEKFYIQTHDEVVVESFRAAYQTGLPLTSGMMSRTSLAQTLNLVQVMSNDMVKKEVLQDYPSDKPLLLLVTKHKLIPEEQTLVDRATLIGKEGTITLYKLELSAFEGKARLVKEWFNVERDTILHAQAPFFLKVKDALVHFDGFDKGGISGFGEETSKLAKGTIDIFNQRLDTSMVGKALRASIWLSTSGESPAFPVFEYVQKDKQGNIIQREVNNPKFGGNVYRDWVLVEHYFTVPDADNIIELKVKGKHIEIESFLLQKKGADVYLPLHSAKQLMYNNYYLDN